MQPIEELNIMKMTRKQFLELPRRKWDEDIGKFNCLVILPGTTRHDSGFRCMSFVACNFKHPICILGGCSDVVHIDGIGGYGKWEGGAISKNVLVKGWSIDCLPVSGLLRLFSNGELTVGVDLSSFEVYSTKKEVANG
jgi:hypothetical protein